MYKSVTNPSEGTTECINGQQPGQKRQESDYGNPPHWNPSSITSIIQPQSLLFGQLIEELIFNLHIGNQVHLPPGSIFGDVLGRKLVWLNAHHLDIALVHLECGAGDWKLKENSSDCQPDQQASFESNLSFHFVPFQSFPDLGRLFRTETSKLLLTWRTWIIYKFIYRI